MFRKIIEHWDQFRHYPAGERFERYYQSRHGAKRGAIKKISLMVLGSLCMIMGVIFLVIPGPGLLLMALGATLIARESLYISRVFDRLEPGLWKLARRNKTK